MLKEFFRLTFIGALAGVAYALAVRPRLLRWGAGEDETPLLCN